MRKFHLSYLLLLFLAPGIRAQSILEYFEPISPLFERYDSNTYRYGIDTVRGGAGALRTWVLRVVDSSGIAGGGSTTYIIDKQHATLAAGIIDSAVDATNKTYTLGYAWYNHSWITGGYGVYGNTGGPDSTLVQWPNGYAVLLASGATPDRLAYKTSYNGGSYGPITLTAPPIGDDSLMITCRIVGNATAGTRTFVLLKHSIVSAAIQPTITQGTEVHREQLSNNGFNGFGTGSVYVRMSLRFRRER